MINLLWLAPPGRGLHPVLGRARGTISVARARVMPPPSEREDHARFITSGGGSDTGCQPREVALELYTGALAKGAPASPRIPLLSVRTP